MKPEIPFFEIPSSDFEELVSSSGISECLRRSAEANRTAVALLKEGRLEEAVSLIFETIESGIESPALYNTIGLAFLSSRDLDAAEDYFNESILLDPSIGITHSNLAATYCEKGEDKKAIDEHIASFRLGFREESSFRNAIHLCNKHHMYWHASRISLVEQGLLNPEDI